MAVFAREYGKSVANKSLIERSAADYEQYLKELEAANAQAFKAAAGTSDSPEPDESSSPYEPEQEQPTVVDNPTRKRRGSSKE